MPKKYAPLSSLATNNCESFHKPFQSAGIVRIDDPADFVFIDFQRVEPLTVYHHQRMYDARQAMQGNNLHLILVLDDLEHLVGVLSLENVLSEEPIKLQEEQRIQRLSVEVETVMTPIQTAPAIAYESMAYAKVGNIIETLNTLQEHYLLVIETNDATQEQSLRGIVNVATISQQIGYNVIKKKLVSSSIADLARVID